jgi:DNA-binding NarL/FixJ family response regulator
VKAADDRRHVAVESTPDIFEAIAAEPSQQGHRRLLVIDDASAGEALRVALRGELLVIHAVAERSVLDRLYEDLRHVAPVTVRTAMRPPSVQDALTEEEAELLRHLAAGRTLGEAAGALHLSRRTAHRRLSVAKSKLGVQTTIEAVAFLAQ